MASADEEPPVAKACAVAEACMRCRPVRRRFAGSAQLSRSTVQLQNIYERGHTISVGKQMRTAHAVSSLTIEPVLLAVVHSLGLTVCCAECQSEHSQQDMNGLDHCDWDWVPAGAMSSLQSSVDHRA